MTTATTRATGDGISPELRAELEDIARDRSCELLKASFRGGRLRLILDRADGGVSLGDCEAVSKEVSALLDVVDFGTGRYTLEVSSPGLDRELLGPRDYERFAGRQVRVTFTDPDAGGKRSVVGRLEEFRPGGGDPAASGEIVVVDPRQEVLTIPLAQIQVARLEIEL